MEAVNLGPQFPATLDLVVKLIESVQAHQAENFADLKDRIQVQNDKIDKEFDDRCEKCTKSATFAQKFIMQWVAISLLGTWVSVVTYYYYILSVELYRHIGKA